MASTPSPGKCLACGEGVTSRSSATHLAACARSKPGRAQVFELQVSHGPGSPYWLHVDAAGSATLQDLASLLRSTWLECCGHLSEFTIDGTRYRRGPDDFEDEDEEGMSTKLADVLSPGLVFGHEYDFGTPTSLRLKVTGVRQGAVARRVAVLARNDPPAAPCGACGKPAEQICGQCVWEGGGLLCAGCARTHKCGEEMLLPFVNSPRAGMCGYTG